MRYALVILLALALPSLSQTADARTKGPGSDIIGGGEVTDPGKYPFMAAILDDSIDGDDADKQFCGGSLIAAQWVLTAAHCFLGAEDVAVAVGRTNLNSNEGHRSEVAKANIYIHPDLDSPVLFANDVALLKLNNPVNTDLFPPIALATDDDDDLEENGVPLTTIGWGTTSTGKLDFPDILHEVTVPVVSDPICKGVYKRFLDEGTMVCAGAPGFDSCVGDSGGPLFAKENTSFVQVGITSWGKGCAKKRFPGVYSEVNGEGSGDRIGIAEWIAETMSSN